MDELPTDFWETLQSHSADILHDLGAIGALLYVEKKGVASTGAAEYRKRLLERIPELTDRLGETAIVVTTEGSAA